MPQLGDVMTIVKKRFRIEEGEADPADRTCSPARPPGGPVVSPDDLARQGWLALGQLMSELTAMRSAIATTKRELAALEVSPSGQDAVHRAAGELDAVSAATASAATAILAAVEDIELSANLLRGAEPGPPRNEAVGTILDRVLVLYETCNFQDIAGQRLRKVVTTLRFVEDRLESLIEAWKDAGAGAAPTRPAAESLLGGPSLPGDPGHISQSDVDRYFI